MTKQKVLNHNIEDDNDDLDYISENCNYCGLELIRVEDILVDEDNNYCCHDCNLYHKLNAKEIKEI